MQITTEIDEKGMFNLFLLIDRIQAMVNMSKEPNIGRLQRYVVWHGELNRREIFESQASDNSTALLTAIQACQRNEDVGPASSSDGKLRKRATGL